MAYNRTIWTLTGTYGPEAFNNIEQGILDLESQVEEGGGGSAYIKKQTLNLANAMKKLRTGLEVDVCFFGDSVLYAYYRGDGKVEEDCIPDKNSPYSERYGSVPTRNPVTIYDSFKNMANRVFDNKITITKKLFSGHTTKWAYEDYNASNSDFVILNFGINDAMGAHVPKEYLGDMDAFLKYYRLVIEREIIAGTAVILLTPVKQTLVVDADDKDDRVLIDVYEQAVENLAKEYSCPCINGNDMTRNFGIELSEDFTHFTADGNKSIGCRLVALFVGQSPLSPMIVSGGSYLGVHPQIDNVNIVSPTVYDYTDISPNTSAAISSGNLVFPIVRIGKGLQATISGGGKVIWSFYCEHDGMVVIPSVYTESEGVGCRMRLDFGVVQPKWNNYWNYIGTSTSIDRNYNEPSEVEIPNNKFSTVGNGKCYGMHMISNSSQPVLKITTKGWHTIEVTPVYPETKLRSVIPEEFGDGALATFGLNFLTVDEYKRKLS